MMGVDGEKLGEFSDSGGWIMEEQREVLYESLDSEASSDSSQLITEEDLINTLFYSCDLNNQGTVPVSRLIEHLQFTTADSHDGEDEISQLQQLLDPDAVDPMVDIDSYRAVVTKWIEQIKLMKSEGSLDWHNDPTAAILSGGPGFRSSIASDASSRPQSVSSTAFYGNSPFCSSLEGAGSPYEYKSIDIGELNSKIENLQYQNQKLAEETSTLKRQLEVAEESSASTIQELENLRKAAKSYHQMCERHRNLLRDNEDMKASILQYEDHQKEVQLQMKKAVKENHQLELQIQNLQEQLSTSSADLEAVSKQKESLHTVFLEQKQLRMQLEEDLEETKILLAEKISQLDDMEENLKEMKHMYEQVKYDKADLEMQLEHSNKELAFNQVATVNSDDDAADLSEADLLIHFADDSHNNSIPSLQSELANSLRSSCDELPVCDKELEDIFAKLNASASDSISQQLQNEVDIILQSTASVDKMTSQANDIAVKFKAKKEAMIEKIQQLTALSQQPSSMKPGSPGKGQEALVNKLQQEIETFTCKIVELAHIKQEADLRITSLSDALHAMKNHLEEQQFNHHETLHRLQQDANILQDELQAQLVELAGKLQQESQVKLQLQEQLEEATKQLEEMEISSKERDIIIKELEKEKHSLSCEIESLRSSTTDLKDKLRKSNDQMSSLKHEVDSKQKQTLLDKEHIDDLEESLTKTQLDRQLDLKELWRLVQKDVENECMSDSQDTPITVSTDSLRDQVAREIYCLRTQLAKSQAALAALNKTLPLKSTTRDSNYDWKPGNKKNRKPSSPLVEALTLDFGAEEGSGDTDRDAYKKQNRSADSILDEPFDSNGNFQVDGKFFALSCPHLNRPGISSATQTEVVADKRRPPKIGANKYTVANTSTGSSTSGAVDLDVSSSSNKSEPQGITPKKSVLIVETVCSPDEGGADPLVRHRTPSFKRAIERGPSAESNNSFEFCDYVSTSPDLSPEHMEHPVYPYAGRDAFRTPNSESHHRLQPDVSDFLQDLTQDNDNHTMLKTSTPNTSLEDSDELASLDPQQIADLKLSPHGGRRLSTLVEEASDAESEDHLHSVRARMPSRKGQMLDIPAGPPPPYRPKTPPHYRSPPAYQHAVQREVSPNRSGAKRPDERPPPPPYHKPVPPPKPSSQPTATHHGQHHEHQHSHHHHVDVRETIRNIEAGYQKYGGPEHVRPPSIERRSQNHSQSGNVAELVNGDLDEVEMTEADKQLNAQLLEEAKQASAASRHKSRTRRRLSSGDLARSQTIDDGDDVFIKETNNNSHPQRPSSHIEENGEDQVSEMQQQAAGCSSQEDAKPSSSGYQALPQAHVAFPSLPNDTLQALGLLVSKEDQLEFAENLSDHELEEKFASLSLAFRTDRLTLEKRIDLHERARDNAEQNITKELTGLKDALKALRTFCADSASREIYSKIQHHVDVLEQCSTRVSSRAECHGAVQQELRLSKAVEVMMQHVESLKMLYDKEHQELEETKKLLQENKAQQEGVDSMSAKRYSLAGIQGKQQSGKRRASVAAFPRRLSMLGGIPSSPRPDPDQPMFNLERPKSAPDEDEDARARFKSVALDTAVKSSVTGAFRRASLEKQRSRENSTSSDVFLPSSSEPNKDYLEVPEIQQPNGSANKDTTFDEDLVFQKGFEEGVRAQVTQELETLREQQSDFSNALDALIEENDDPDEDDNSSHLSLKSNRILTDEAVMKLRALWDKLEITQLHVRYTLAGLVLVMGLVSVLLTLIPGGHATSRQLPVIHWDDIEAMVKPYVKTTYHGPAQV